MDSLELQISGAEEGHDSGPGFMGLPLPPAMTLLWSSSQEVPSWETPSSSPASLLLVISYPMEHRVTSAAGAVSPVRADHRDSVWGKWGRGSQQKPSLSPPLNSPPVPTFSPILPNTNMSSGSLWDVYRVPSAPEHRASKTP